MASKSRNQTASLRPSTHRRTRPIARSQRRAGRGLSVEMVENRLLMTANGFSTDLAHDSIFQESETRVAVAAPDQQESAYRRDTIELDDRPSGSHDLVLDDVVRPVLTDPHVEIRLNHDMEAVTETILPEIAEDFELESFSMNDIPITSGTVPNWITDTLLRCHRDYDWQLNVKSLTVNTPVNEDTFDVRFKNGNEIELDADMDAFKVYATLEFDWPKNDTWWCDTFGTNIHFETDVTVSGLEAEFDVIVDAAANSSINIVDIDKFELELDDVAFADSFLDTLVDGAITIGETIGLLDCGDLDDCINDEIDKQLKNTGDVEDFLQNAVDSFIDNTLDIGDTVDAGEVELTYAVGLENIETSGPDDRLSTFWDVDVSSDEDAHYCAEDLTRQTYSVPTEYTTDEDVEAVIPFGVITDTMYEAGQQGVFCTDFEVEHNGVQLSAAVKPHGAVTVESGAESQWTAVFSGVDTNRSASTIPGGITSTPTEPISLPDSESLIFTIPMAVDVTGGGDTGSLGTIGGVPGAIEFDLPYNFDAEVTGDLVVTTRLSSSETDGLELLFESIDVRNLDTTVSVDVGPVSVDVDSADLSEWIEEALDEQLDRDLPVLQLLPHVIDLDATGKYELQLNEVESDGYSIAVGFSIEIDTGTVDTNGPRGGDDGGYGPTTPPQIDVPQLELEDPTWQTVDGSDSDGTFGTDRSQAGQQYGSAVPGPVLDADAVDLVVQDDDASQGRHDDELFGALEADLMLTA